MKKIYFVLCMAPFSLFAQAPSDYYQGTDNLSGYALKTQIQKIISTKSISWHYGNLGGFYAETDLDRYYENNGTLLDIYSEKPDGPDAYEYNTDQLISSSSGEGQGWNREHVVPQSTFNSNYPMYSDLLFVIPTDARINQLRSNYPYGVAGVKIYHSFSNGSKIGDSAIPGATYTGRVYEPIDEFKGDVARMLLYYAVRYEGKLSGFNFNTNADPTKDQNPFNGTEEKAFEDWYIQMLMSWHNLDPVSQREIDRNNYVYNIQKNRNPFIDNPQWVSAIWNQTPDGIAPQAPSNLTISKNSAYFVNLQWQASTDTDVLGYEVYKDGVFLGKTKSTSFNADQLSPSTTYSFSVKSYDNGYLVSPLSNTVSGATLDTDIYAKDLMVTKYLEGSNDNRALEIANFTGHDVNLEGYRLGIQFRGGNNFYFEKPLELEGKLAHGETLVAINAKAAFSCFNNLDADFISLAPSLTFTGVNYVDLSYKNTTVDAIGVKGIANDNGDKSLYRISTVTQPTTTFNAAEWDTYASDYCVGLGADLSTNDVVRLANISVYPNPTTDVIYIKGLDKTVTVQIFDASGKLVMSVNKADAKAGIDVRNLAKGVYMLNVNNQVTKFIKN